MGNIDYLSNARKIREQTLAVKRAEFAQEVEASFQLKLNQIDPNPYQPRVDFSAVEQMAQSLKEHGQYYPILVRRVGDRYQVADGETRLRAARLNLERNAQSPDTITAVLKPYTDVDMAVIAFRTAYDRKELNPIEEARGLQRLRDELGIEYQEIAQRLGRTESYVYDRTRLLGLHALLIEEVAQEKLSPSAAIKLQALDLVDEAELQRVIDLVHEERITVKGIVAQRERLLKAAKAEEADAPSEADPSKALWKDLHTIWKHLSPEARQELVKAAAELAARNLKA